MYGAENSIPTVAVDGLVRTGTAAHPFDGLTPGVDYPEMQEAMAWKTSRRSTRPDEPGHAVASFSSCARRY